MDDDVTVRGVDLDPASRCAHYDGDRDVVAIRFVCCGEWFACIRCHEVVADHESETWPRDSFDVEAVRCGACGTTHTIRAYLDADDACPACSAPFNPGCANHYHHYFAVEEA